jgi:hypothetical protein
LFVFHLELILPCSETKQNCAVFVTGDHLAVGLVGCGLLDDPATGLKKKKNII